MHRFHWTSLTSFQARRTCQINTMRLIDSNLTEFLPKYQLFGCPLCTKNVSFSLMLLRLSRHVFGDSNFQSDDPRLLTPQGWAGWIWDHEICIAWGRFLIHPRPGPILWLKLNKKFVIWVILYREHQVWALFMSPLNDAPYVLIYECKTLQMFQQVLKQAIRVMRLTLWQGLFADVTKDWRLNDVS